MRQLAIIMSVYKGDKLQYVKLAVESVLSQTFEDLDLYMMCDGPLELDIHKFLLNLRDDRVKIYDRKENFGLAYSLNELLEIVFPKGYQYIARMDADDISRMDRFEKQLDFLNEHLNVDVVGGAINEIDDNGNNRGKIVHYPLTNEDCKAFFKKRNPLAHPTVVFRRSFFEKTSCFYSSEYIRNEDTFLWYQGFLHNAIFANINSVVLDFRVTDSFFHQRRRGVYFAKSQLLLRKRINNDLGFGFLSNFYAYLMYLLMIAPTWLLKIAYKWFR